MVKKTEIITELEKNAVNILIVVALRNLAGDQLGIFQCRGTAFKSMHCDKHLSYNTKMTPTGKKLRFLAPRYS